MKARVPMSPEGIVESDPILEQSSVLREFRKEMHEIDKLKWLESERTGHDIGYEQALLMWAHKHRSIWRAARKRRAQKQGK